MLTGRTGAGALLRLSLVLLVGQAHVCGGGVGSGRKEPWELPCRAPRLVGLRVVPQTAAHRGAAVSGTREAGGAGPRARAAPGAAALPLHRLLLAAVCGEHLLRSLECAGGSGTRLRLRGGSASHQPSHGRNGTAVSGRGWGGIAHARGSGPPLRGRGVLQTARGAAGPGLPGWAGGAAGAGGRGGRGGGRAGETWWSGSKRSAPPPSSSAGSGHEPVRGAPGSVLKRRRELIGRGRDARVAQVRRDARDETPETWNDQERDAETGTGVDGMEDEEAEEEGEGEEDEGGGEGGAQMGNAADDTAHLKAMYEQAYMCVCVYVYVRMCMYMYMCMCMCMYMYM